MRRVLEKMMRFYKKALQFPKTTNFIYQTISKNFQKKTYIINVPEILL